MSIPTHNLYDFVYQVTERRFHMLYFYPWGEKSLCNLSYNKDHFENCSPKVSEILYPEVKFPIGVSMALQPTMVCHDQEPLNFDLYNDQAADVQQIIEQNKIYRYNLFPNYNLRHAFAPSRQKFWVLLHSEINSSELQKYEDTGKFRGAYWWSHAIIARDWYRYAQFDNRLNHQKIEKLFLIYCRDVTGSRRYRSDFLKKIDIRNLSESVNYGSHHVNPVSSAASADYDAKDFSTTGISVILETIFEDHRIHFTEKILRAIACGHPFIVANGHGSLEVLKRYGFKTFSPYIDESYDRVVNAEERLDTIVNELDRLSKLPNIQEIVGQCREIANFNRLHFFSNSFFNTVVKELIDNVNSLELPNFGLDHRIFSVMRNQRDYSDSDPQVIAALKDLARKLENNINIS